MTPILVVIFVLLVALVRGDIGPEGFKALQASEDVHLVEYYSPMCGSCKEFSPEWEKIEAAAKELGIMTAKVNVDKTEGVEVAQSQHILAEGIPQVRLYHKRGENRGDRLLVGESKPASDIIEKVKGLIHSNSKHESTGVHIKSAAHDEL